MGSTGFFLSEVTKIGELAPSMIAGCPVAALNPKEPTGKWRASRNPRPEKGRSNGLQRILCYIMYNVVCYIAKKMLLYCVCV